MRRVNLALFLITVAIVLFSLLRSVLSGPSGRAVELKPRSPVRPLPQATLAELNRHPAIDCSLTLDSIGSVGPANPYLNARQWPAKATTRAGPHQTQKNKLKHITETKTCPRISIALC